MNAHQDSKAHGKAIALQTRELVVLVLAGLALFFLYSYTPDRAPVASSETQFTDPSVSGLSIVPASCPSQPHYDGHCSASCTPQYFCAGASGNLRYYRDAVCEETYVETCAYGCYNGQCLAAEGMQFSPFSATRGDGSGFSATGHLQLSPSIVRSGDSTRIYWKVLNAVNCSVTGSNGDSWANVTDSGTTGRVTGVINQQVIYTLTCAGPNGSTPASITEHAAVNIIPAYTED